VAIAEPAPPPVDLEEEEGSTAAATGACGPPAPVLAAGGPQSLTIAAVAERMGITAHTLRYYERIGLLDVPRDRAGRRRYGETELARIVFITRLRLTAMRIRDIQAYFQLVAAGPGNEAERLALLERHRDQVRTRLAELRAALEVIDFKIATYGGVREP
jgi:DNA-binding transcriptional MerR regulator